MWKHTAIGLFVALSSTAWAQGVPPEEDELPVPSLTIDRFPPSSSYELGIQFGYGKLPVWDEYQPAWVGFGIGAGFGKNVGASSRFGGDALLAIEGPIGIFTTVLVEPHAAYEFVGPKGLALGAGIGPSFMYSERNDTVYRETSVNVGAAMLGHVGWSQTFSRVGRRLFVLLEPKVKAVSGESTLKPTVAVIVGLGKGA